MKKPHHTARAGLTYNKIRTADRMIFSHQAIKLQLNQDFEEENPYWVDEEGYPFAKTPEDVCNP
jgi:hypothetical protein